MADRHAFDNLEFFLYSEFKRPELMDEDFLLMLDELRRRCDFPLLITSDGRIDEDMERIYGSDRDGWPNSPHKRGRAVDLQPIGNTSRNRLRLIHEVIGMHLDGEWTRLGLEIADRHIHVDDDRELRRPYLWIGKSR